MLINRFENTYNITLPPSTAKEVVEWFEIMENNGKLADALVELVYESIRTGKASKVCSSYFDNQDEANQAQNDQPESNGDFFDNLYNWQDSNSAIFKEEKEVKKEKKRMLSV